MCSCTILTENYILARSACISSTQTGKIQVHAGASDAANADQVVDACLLDTAERPPEGVVVLLLAKNLTFDANVSKFFHSPASTVTFRNLRSLTSYFSVFSGSQYKAYLLQFRHLSWGGIRIPFR